MPTTQPLHLPYQPPITTTIPPMFHMPQVHPYSPAQASVYPVNLYQTIPTSYINTNVAQSVPHHHLPALTHVSQTQRHTNCFVSPVETKPLISSGLKKIQRIQEDIDRVQSQGGSLSGQSSRTRKLRTLHQRLNAALDGATGRDEEQSDSQEPSVASGTMTTQPRLGDTTEVQHRGAPRQTARRTVVPDRSDRGDLYQKHATKPGLHLCSNCGNIRSRRFHTKHPWDAGQRAILNYCESCRMKKITRGALEDYHFCFGCGKVKSTAFQKAHATDPDRPLILSYCAKCDLEISRSSDNSQESSDVQVRLSYPNSLKDSLQYESRPQRCLDWHQVEEKGPLFRSHE